jgi:hypothetical protein
MYIRVLIRIEPPSTSVRDERRSSATIPGTLPTAACAPGPPRRQGLLVAGRANARHQGAERGGKARPPTSGSSVGLKREWNGRTFGRHRSMVVLHGCEVAPARHVVREGRGTQPGPSKQRSFPLFQHLVGIGLIEGCRIRELVSSGEWPTRVD